jgi:hypothetical protein
MKWHARLVVSGLMVAVGCAHPQSLPEHEKAEQQTPMRGQSAAHRQIAAPCRLVEERAIRYLEEHDFYTRSTTEGDDIVVGLGPRKNASTPSAKPLSLNRFSIHKYTLPRHLSPLKEYDFRLVGQLRLANTTGGFCDATLRFEFSAYEWVWALAVIDDGLRSQFISNGALERPYLDPISDLFINGKF